MPSTWFPTRLALRASDRADEFATRRCFRFYLSYLLVAEFGRWGLSERVCRNAYSNEKEQ